MINPKVDGKLHIVNNNKYLPSAISYLTKNYNKIKNLKMKWKLKSLIKINKIDNDLFYNSK